MEQKDFFIEWYNEDLERVCLANLTEKEFRLINPDNITQSFFKHHIAFEILDKEPIKDIEVWFNYTYRTFNLDEDWEFLLGKTINSLKVNRIDRNKSVELQKFMNDIFPAFLRINKKLKTNNEKLH